MNGLMIAEAVLVAAAVIMFFGRRTGRNRNTSAQTVDPLSFIISSHLLATLLLAE
jgi:hypothetical protein